MIYLDYAASTPMSDEALQTFLSASKQYFANERSLHDLGSNSALLLKTARKQLATLLESDESSIYFTSGGTESNSLAIQTLLESSKKTGKQIITTKCEHSSILNLLERFSSNGYEITYIPVNENGVINLDELQKNISENTVLAIFQHVNSEIGTIQPIEEISEILSKYDILFHCDCVQSFGKIEVNPNKLGVTSLSISSHKLYGPKGVGAVYINPSIAWEPLIPGTSHENGFRAGTVNVPAIASFVTAASTLSQNLRKNYEHYRMLHEELKNQLKPFPNKFTIEGDSKISVPHIIGMRILGLEGQYVLLECNRHQLAISTGSACSIGMQNPSNTLLAIGRNESEAKQFFRVSFGIMTTVEDIKKLGKVLISIAENNE